MAADVTTLHEEEVDDDVFFSPASSAHKRVKPNTRGWPQRNNDLDRRNEVNLSNYKENQQSRSKSSDKAQESSIGPKLDRFCNETLESGLESNLPNQTVIPSLCYNSKREDNMFSAHFVDAQALLMPPNNLNKLPPLQAEHLASVRLPYPSTLLTNTAQFQGKEHQYSNGSNMQPISNHNWRNEDKLISVKLGMHDICNTDQPEEIIDSNIQTRSIKKSIPNGENQNENDKIIRNVHDKPNLESNNQHSVLLTQHPSIAVGDPNAFRSEQTNVSKSCV